MFEPTRRPLLVVDGDNLAHRAYHSMPRSLRGADDRPIGAIVGWTTMLLALWGGEQPRAVFVGWDTLDAPTYRHALLPTYQAGREFDEAIVEQLRILPALGQAFGFGVAQQPGYEADDLMAAAALEEARQGGTALVLTTDRDFYQVVSDAVTVLNPRKGVRLLERIGPREVEARMGVPPSLVPDFKALAGDPSDNIPGARGIGPKGAAALLMRYGGLDAVLDAWTAEGQRLDEIERIRSFRRITRMQTDAVVTLPETGAPDWARGAEMLRTLGAANLAERVTRNGA
jgi:DNA polymerase-1